jgi:hypothetical protein
MKARAASEEARSLSKSDALPKSDVLSKSDAARTFRVRVPISHRTSSACSRGA